MQMNESIKTVIAGNVEKLMEYHGKRSHTGKVMTQTSLAQKTGVDQKTISNLLNRERIESINSNTIEAIAKFFNLEPYHLLIPNLPIEELVSKRIEKVVECYSQVNMQSRENIERIAENEVRYCANRIEETKSLRY